MGRIDTPSNAQSPSHMKPPRLLRMPAVIERCGLSRTTIYMRIAIGTFPKQIPVGPRVSAWLESEIEAWIDECVQARDGAHARATR